MKHRNLRVRALDCVTAILSMKRAWRGVFLSRAVLELGGLPARQGGTKAKLTTLPNQEFWLPALRSRVRARGLVHGYFLRRESLFLFRTFEEAQKIFGDFPIRDAYEPPTEKGNSSPGPNQTLMVCVTAIDNAGGGN